ncbi:MAG: putative Ig domain-containing protein [Acidimicrobiales bacterium]
MSRGSRSIQRLRRQWKPLVFLGLLVAVVSVLTPDVAPPAAAARGPAASTPPGGLTFRATGYFRIGHSEGRAWLVTPQGRPFFSTGVDHVTPYNDVDQTTGLCPYCQTIAKNYPSTSAWATATVSRLRSWGFNSLGPFSDVATFGAQMPFSVQLSMASGNDWFAPSFVTNANQVAATQVAPLAHNPNLIGFYTDSELHWGPGSSDPQPVLDNYLALPAGSPGRAVAERYLGDPNGFVYALATRYFQVTTAAVRRYDPHHLILGVKAESQQIQPQLLEAARPYVNVFSIDNYTLKPGLAQIIHRIWPQYLPVEPNFANFERYLKRPIMVGEYSFIGSGPATPDTVPQVYAVYPTQAARAAAYTYHIAPLYLHAPWFVGDEWFEYVDEPQGGRVPDGENNNFGLVNVLNQPYQDLVTQMEILHSMAPDRLTGSSPTCDSWAEGPHGVVCTAEMANPRYPLQLFTSTLAGAKVGKRYSGTLVAIGGRPAYTFTLTGGSLPEGLRLDPATGLIRGTPKVPGAFALTVRVTDSSNPVHEVTSQPVSITIAPRSLSILSTRLHPEAVGTSFCRQLVVRGGVAPYSWSVTSGGLPVGVALDQAGRLAGTPSATGTTTFAVTATDSFDPVDTATASETLPVVSTRAATRGIHEAHGAPRCRSR